MSHQTKVLSVGIPLTLSLLLGALLLSFFTPKQLHLSEPGQQLASDFKTLPIRDSEALRDLLARLMLDERVAAFDVDGPAMERQHWQRAARQPAVALERELQLTDVGSAHFELQLLAQSSTPWLVWGGWLLFGVSMLMLAAAWTHRWLRQTAAKSGAESRSAKAHADHESELVEQVEQLRSKTFIDAQTGLANRQFFESEFNACLYHPETSNAGYVILIELGLEEYEDTRLADLVECIRAQAATLPYRLLARLSRSTFAVLATSIAEEPLHRFARQTVKRVAQMIHAEESIHLGIAAFQSGDEAYQRLSEADMAVRSAQYEGDNGWYRFETGMLPGNQIRGRVRWQALLQNVIESGGLVWHYQPMFDCQAPDRVAVQHELLARIPLDKEWMTAATFMPMAKECGLQPSLDRLLLSKLFKHWHFSAQQMPRLTVNLALDSLLQRQFVDWLLQQLECHKAIARHLTLELSEHEVDVHAAQIKSLLATLRGQGVRICVDRVGTPLARTSYLHQLPIDALKLHHSVVSGIGSSDLQESRQRQQLIIKLRQHTQNMGIALWAEGIESRADLDWCCEHGIEQVQGYWLSEPLTDLPVMDDAPTAEAATQTVRDTQESQ